MAQLEEITLPPSSYRIRIGEPCSPLIDSEHNNVDLVVSLAMMKRLRKAPVKMQLDEDDDAPVAYVFSLETVKPGQKYQRLGYHTSEAGQTAIIDLETVYRTGDAAAEFLSMQDGELWTRLFQRPRGSGKEPWGNKARLPDVKRKISRAITFLGDVPLSVTDKANVFIHRDAKTTEIDSVVIDTGCLFPLDPPPPPVASSVSAAPVPAATSPTTPPPPAPNTPLASS